MREGKFGRYFPDVVPLPPGVPYEDQQDAWAGWEKDVLEIPPEEMAGLARRIGERV